MRFASKMVFDVAALVILATFLILAAGYNAQARLVPLVLGIPGFILMLIQAYSDFRLRGEGDRRGEGPAGENSQVAGREANVMIWIFGLVVLLYLAGFAVGSAVFTFLFLGWRERFGWIFSCVVGAAIFLVINLGFIRLLQTDLYPGVIQLLLQQ